MRHGSDPGDVCVVQGRSVVVTWAGSGQVKVQKKQANVKDSDYVITPYRSPAERDRPPVYRRQRSIPLGGRYRQVSLYV